MDDDHYETLGIHEWASAPELRRAWRKLALRWHPDRAGAESKAIFQKIQAAYTVLADPIARAAYDRRRGTPMRQAPPEAPRRRAPDAMLRRLSGWLHMLLASGAARHAEDGIIELLLGPHEVAAGGIVTINMRVLIRCPDCAVHAPAPCPGTVEETFSAWLTIPPEVAEGTLLSPSVLLPGMVGRPTFRVRFR